MSDAVTVNGRTITYADWRAEADKPLFAPLLPSERGRVAWNVLVRRALRGRCPECGDESSGGLCEHCRRTLR